MVKMGYDECQVSAHHHVNHEVTQRLAQHNAEYSVVMLGDRHQVFEAVVLASGARCQSYAEQQGLLDDKHQHAREDGVAVAACGVEDRNLVEIKWLGCYLVIALCEIGALCYLYLCVHVRRHGLCRLVDGLVGKHQAHVAIHAHLRLLPSVEAALKVLGEVKRAMHLLLRGEILGLFQ